VEVTLRKISGKSWIILRPLQCSLYHSLFPYTYKMAGKKRRGQKTPNFSTTNPSVNNAKGKKLESYEDTLEPGSTDHRMSFSDDVADGRYVPERPDHVQPTR
jgi:hypothetical protein